MPKRSWTTINELYIFVNFLVLFCLVLAFLSYRISLSFFFKVALSSLIFLERENKKDKEYDAG